MDIKSANEILSVCILNLCGCFWSDFSYNHCANSSTYFFFSHSFFNWSTWL